MLNKLNTSSLKFRLVASIGALALITALILSLFVSQLTRQQLEHDQGSLLQLMAIRMSTQLAQDMHTRATEILLLSQLDCVRQRDCPTIKKQALFEKLRAAYSHYAWIGMTDTEGNILASTDGLLVGKNVAKREWFAKGKSGLHFGDAHDAFLLAKIMPKPKWDDLPLRLVDVSAPVFDEKGKFIGVIAAHLSLDWAFEVRERMLDHISREHLSLVVLRHDGKVLMGTPDLPSLKVDLSDLLLVLEADKNQQPGQVVSWPDRQEYLTAVEHEDGFKKYPGLGWSVLVRIPEEVAFASARWLSLVFLFAGVASATLFALLLWWMLKRDLRPLEKLSVAAERIRREDLDAEIPKPTGKDEVAVCSRSLAVLVKALQERNTMLSLLTSSVKDYAIIMIDPHGKIVTWNEGAVRVKGYKEPEIIGRSIDCFYSAEDVTAGKPAHMMKMASKEGRCEDEVWRVRKDGSDYFANVILSAMNNKDGELVGFVEITRDITERKTAEDELRIAATTFETQEAILITDSDSTILRVNQAFQDITGYCADEVVGQNPRILQSGQHDAAFYQSMWSELHRKGKWAGEIWDKRKNGEIYPKHMTITAVKDANQKASNYVAVFTDISQRKQSEQEIHQLAFYDQLTHLPNRRLLLDRLQQAMEVSHRNGAYGALLFLDLDHFKKINDTKGHPVGDLLLIETAHRLKSVVRKGDTVSRLGGDEFIVLLEGLSKEKDVAATQTEHVAGNIHQTLCQPYFLQNQECHSSPSIGISIFRGHQENVEELLKHADVAMYKAKEAGRNAIRFFDPDMQTALDKRSELEADLRQALEKQEFQLYYQIQVDNQCRPLGAEVLLRWKHPVRGFVFPDQFIPLAEETGLILPIGHWVMQTACAQLKAWEQQLNTRDLSLAVNVSAEQFRQPDFVTQVEELVLDCGIQPSLLKLELTESVVLDDVEDAIRKMNEIQKLGVVFSMDDFGTGYSSLSQLKRLPLNQIKIDRSFVMDITTDPNDAAIVNTIIAMSQALGLNAIAEGVETEQQRKFLEDHGCFAYQGYLFSKPIPLDQFEQYLNHSFSNDEG